MSDLITLDLAKEHLRVINTDEDNLIKLFIDAALDNVSEMIDRPIDGTDPKPVVFDDADPPNVLALKPSLHAAALLIIGDFYENREAQSVGTKMELTPNPTVDRLIAPYRKLGV